MTGIERLRKLSEDMLSLSLWGLLTSGTEKDWDCYQGDGRTANDELLSIADQIEQEARAPFSRVRVLAVISDMESRVSDEGGSFGALVARWARELRGAVCSGERDPAEDVSVSAYDLLPQEDRDALAWVRDHGGLSHVKDIYHDFRAVVERIGVEWSESELHGLMDALDRRLMPEGCEWPRYESGELVRIGDVVSDVEVRNVVFRDGVILLSDCTSVPGWGTWRSYREPIKRPAVLAADGEPLEVGQTVWDTDAEADTPLTIVEVSSDLVRCEYTWKDGKTYRPCYPPDQLTHTKPEPPDSAERIAEDIKRMAEEWCSYPSLREASEKAASSVGEATMGVALSNLSKRCRALAERERGEE